MTIRILHATSLSIKMNGRIFGVLITGADDSPMCWITAEERGREENALILSHKFKTLVEARAAWHYGFTVPDTSDPIVQGILDTLIAGKFAESVVTTASTK